MFFTRLGKFLAWIGLVLGVLRVGTGVYIAVNMDTPGFQPSRYLGSRSSGEAIDQGIMWIVFAVALGILAEIGKSVFRKD